jgi:hypothetical protein
MISSSLDPRYLRPAARASIQNSDPNSFNKGELKGLKGTTVLIPRNTGGAKKPFKTTDQWGNIVAEPGQITSDPGTFNKGELKGLKGVSVQIPRAPTEAYAEKSLKDHFGGESDPSKTNALLRGLPSAMEEFKQKYSKEKTDMIMKDLTGVLVEEYKQRGITALNDEDWVDVKAMLDSSALINKMKNKQEILTFVSNIPRVAPAPAAVPAPDVRPEFKEESPESKSESEDWSVDFVDERKASENVSTFLDTQTSRASSVFKMTKDDRKILGSAFNVGTKKKNIGSFWDAMVKDPTVYHLIANDQMTPSFVSDVDDFGLSSTLSMYRDRGQIQSHDDIMNFGSSYSGMRGFGLSKDLSKAHHHPRTHFVAKSMGMRDFL